MIRRRYDRQGVLAVSPQAFFEMFFEAPTRENTTTNEVAIVDIRGPLDHHGGPGSWFDSYDEIIERVEAACMGAANTVMLRIDSPGGAAQGCFEAAREIRQRCAAAGKRLVAYVDGQACSAAYALACAAEEIVTSETGILGSIGVLNCRIDATAADANFGLRFALTTSGSRKADGHPHLALSEGELAATQAMVDSLAESFFALVEEMRGISRKDVASLQAGVFHGQHAVDRKLADRVQSFSALLASLASGGKAMGLKEARAALEEAAKGEGEEAEKAKKALAAMDAKDEEPEPDAESDEDKGGEAESDDGKEDEEDKDKDEESKSSASTKTVTISAETYAAMTRQLAAMDSAVKKTEAQQRSELLKDLPDALRKALATAPLADVQAAVAAMPKAPKVKAPKAAPTKPHATRGEGQTNSLSDADPGDPELAAIDRAMGFGLGTPPKQAERRGNTLYLGRAPTEKKV